MPRLSLVRRPSYLVPLALSLVPQPSSLLFAQRPDAKMSFFITSRGPGNGATLGGLEGADRHCTMLAAAVGATNLTWRAYLSAVAEAGKPAVNARDRIGAGPWFNYAGVEVAKDVADLHSDNNKLGKETSLTEKGEKVNGRGDTPNMHDILTGSSMDGRVVSDTLDTTCRNWTAGSADGGAWVGHHDRQGGGQNPTSWNSAHRSRGCGQPNLVATGGNGLFYCFGSR
ncbi:MAG TPA: hypothetical protein VJK71_06460 [Gemmatimonadales bacterium]|nr:hypothetical protein [Gemmatimonadales bacterium]